MLPWLGGSVFWSVIPPKGGGFDSRSGPQNSLEINSISKNCLAPGGAVSPQPERFLKMSKHHTQVEGSIPGWGMYGRQPMFLSPSLKSVTKTNPQVRI